MSDLFAPNESDKASDERWGRDRFIPESALRTASEHSRLRLGGNYCYLLYHATEHEAEQIRRYGLECPGLVELEEGQTRSDLDAQLEELGDFSMDMWATEWHPATYADGVPLTDLDMVKPDTFVLCVDSEKVNVFNSILRGQALGDFETNRTNFLRSEIRRENFAEKRHGCTQGQRMDEWGSLLHEDEPRLHEDDLHEGASYVVSARIDPRYWIPHNQLPDSMKATSGDADEDVPQEHVGQAVP